MANYSFPTLAKAVTVFAFAWFNASANAATWKASSNVADYTLAMDNGVVYLYHASIVAPCLYGRVEIRTAEPYSTDYTKRLTALLFSAYFSGRAINFVWDEAGGANCLLYSVTVPR